jgi:hypothetical protein
MPSLILNKASTTLVMLATSKRVMVVDAVTVGRVAAVGVEGVVVMHAKTTASKMAAAIIVLQVAAKE